MKAAEKKPALVRFSVLKALNDWERKTSLDSAKRWDQKLSPTDKRLFREILYGTVRWRGFLDSLWKKKLKKPNVHLPMTVQNILRMSLYQCVFLERIPRHAVVHDAVELCRWEKTEAFCSLVNAVLRSLSEEECKKPNLREAPWEELALQGSFPKWLLERWKENWGEQQARRLLDASNMRHPLFLRIQPGKEEAVLKEMTARGVSLSRVEGFSGAYRVDGKLEEAFEAETFKKGFWIVQDLAQQAMIETVPIDSNERVWDVCAAPGGKTTALAWKIGAEGWIFATEKEEKRRLLLEENVTRLQLKNVHIGRSEKLRPPSGERFSLVWVDAPCSGTAVLSRRVDLRWRLNPLDIPRHAEQQTKLLEDVSAFLYEEGLLVYSTCTLEPEENEGVVQAFCSRTSFQPVLEDLRLPKGLPFEKTTGGIRLWPAKDHDGGFFSILKKDAL